MARMNPISVEIYKRHIKLYRYINDTWIFTQLISPQLKIYIDELRNSKSMAKKTYVVPKRDKTALSKRRDSDISKIFQAQLSRGVFETNIVGIISRVEAFIQECIVIAIKNYPQKLSKISEKTGIPLSLFLEHKDWGELLESFIAYRCEGLMFQKPIDYIAKLLEVLSIEKFDDKLIEQYIEIKASRDIIVHNLGKINYVYIEKTKGFSRGKLNENLVIDAAYFKHVVLVTKAFSGAIQREVEAKFQ